MTKRKGTEPDQTANKKIKYDKNGLSIDTITKDESEEDLILDFENISAIIKVEPVLLNALDVLQPITSPKPANYNNFSSFGKRNKLDFDLHVRVEHIRFNQSDHSNTLNMMLTDSESQTLHAEVWGISAIKLQKILQIGHCYSLQHWSYRAATKTMWTRSNHKFMVKLNEENGNAIEFDDADFPHEKFKPISFNDIALGQNNDIFDVVGIVIHYAAQDDYTNHMHNQLTLLDNKGHQCIIYTKYIEEAIASLDITVKKTIIGFKGVQKLSSGLKSFDAKCFPDTNVIINPTCTMTDILKRWYERCTKK